MKFGLDTIFRFDDNMMEILNIETPHIIENNEELWTYVKFDRDKKYIEKRRYLISTYGRIYDFNKRSIMKLYDSFSSSKGNYKETSFVFEKGKSGCYLVHRLVALSFIPNEDDERKFVNHIDGIPYHNYVWNLEWVTASENYIHALKTGLKKEPIGEQRSNALWTDNEIHIVCKLMEEGHKATYIYNVLGDLLKDPKVEYERVRTLYKHIIRQTHWTHISSQYDIDFTRFNYAKEQMSVSNYKKRKEEKLLSVD